MRKNNIIDFKKASNKLVKDKAQPQGADNELVWECLSCGSMTWYVYTSADKIECAGCGRYSNLTEEN